MCSIAGMSKIALVIISWLSFAEPMFYESVFWTTTNPEFYSKCSDVCPPTGLRINVPPSTKLNIVCPNSGIILSRLSNNVPNELLHENFIMVDEEDYNACIYNSSKSRDSTRILMNCTNSRNTGLQYYLIVFQEISAQDDYIPFKPGHTYYFISTSDGTADSLLNNRGPGHCDDSKNNLTMKLEVYVCKDKSDCEKQDKNKTNCQCPEPPSPSSSPSPSPSHSIHSSALTPTPTLVHTSQGSSLYKPSSSASKLQGSSSIKQSSSPCPTLPPTTDNRTPDENDTQDKGKTLKRSESESLGVKNCLVWLILIILFLICSVVVNCILCVKCRSYGNMQNASSAVTITSLDKIAQDNEKKKGPDYAVFYAEGQNGTICNGKSGVFTNKTYSVVSEPGDAYHEGQYGNELPLKCPSTETISEQNEEGDNSPETSTKAV